MAMNESVGGWLSRLRRSWGASLAAIGALGLLLQIPISMIGGLILEREQRRQAAVDDISSKWGSRQLVTGPVLVVPYLALERSTGPDGREVVKELRRAAVFLPDRLAVDASLDAQTRSRGIFNVPVYRLAARVSGTFAKPDFAFLDEAPAEILWGQAQLALGVSDVRAMQEQPSLAWDDTALPFEPGPGGFAFDAFAEGPPEGTEPSPRTAVASPGRGVHVSLALDGAAASHEFSFPLALNGTGALRFVPMGRATEVKIRSNSPNPSFQGAWLPSERRVDGRGFEAAWSIPYLGRGYPQAWDADDAPSVLIAQSAFGVTLVEPVDPYRMAERSIKYASLFVVLTFAAVWVIEVVGARRVHWIQYLLVGAALCMFFLLELSLAEHIGFDLAYLLAAAGVVGMIAAYGRAVLGGWRLAALVGAGVALLYGYLYLLLINEDYSLLGGSVGLFAMLAAAMYATRKVDWYGVAGSRAT
jgi:inner membrane protein